MYDEINQNRSLAEPISRALQLKFQMGYLLRTLYARSKSGGYEGFAHYFKTECGRVRDDIDFGIESAVAFDEEIFFETIPAIPTKGSKLIDLVVILLNKSKDNLRQLDEIISGVDVDLVSKIVCGEVFSQFAKSELLRIKFLERLKKSLDKAMSNHSMIIAIDNKLIGV